jgi:hypothetical protein
MERKRDGNRRDRQVVESIAQEKAMTALQRRQFGDYIESVKRAEGRGGADNFTREELLELADEFLEL